MPAFAATLAALAVASPCSDPVVALRCPDLVMMPPSGLRARRTPGGRTLLRMANRIVNVGAGPAELVGRRSGAREMTATQVIADGEGTRRRYATGAELYYTSVPTRGGDYWKMDNAARFELWSVDAAGSRTALVRFGPKLRYCLRDLQRLRPDVPGSPRRRIFGACRQARALRTVTLGTSLGWADVYPADYPGNYIDVTGLAGCFDVVQRADPLDHVLELVDTNNESSVRVALPYRRGPQPCPPAPPAPVR